MEKKFRKQCPARKECSGRNVKMISIAVIPLLLNRLTLFCLAGCVVAAEGKRGNGDSDRRSGEGVDDKEDGKGKWQGGGETPEIAGVDVRIGPPPTSAPPPPPPPPQLVTIPPPSPPPLIGGGDQSFQVFRRE